MDTPATPSRAVFRVGDWTVEPETCRLARTGEDRFLRPKLVDLLLLLARHPNQVLTKNQILDQVWHTRFVSESALTRNVAELRRTLDDRARPARYIETIPKRGYRLIAEVSRLRAFAEPTLAVIPFENLNHDPDEEYFADGMTDAVITELAKLPGLRVISRQSVLRYKGARVGIPDVARELGVDAVVEGSALHARSRVRITAQLIQVEPERHLWADSYDGELADVLSIQARVARTVADSVRGVLTPGDRARLERKVTIDPDAQLAYLKARHLIWKWTEDGMRLGLQYLGQVVSKAPEFAPAWGLQAECLEALGFWGFLPARQAYPQAKTAALRALDLDPSHAESRAALGMILWHLDWDFDGAERELRRSVELAPSNEVARMSLGMFLLLVRGLPGEAKEQVRVALALDPLSLSMNFNVAWFLLFAGEYQAALDAARKTLEMYPHALHAHYVTGWTNVALGDPAGAVTAFERALTLGRDPMSVAYLAVATARAGDEDTARALLAEMQERRARDEVPAVALAMVSAALGARDEAFGWLEVCREERDSRLFWLPVRPLFDGLRDDPRFEAFVRGSIGPRPAGGGR
jgi:TolB-like protein/Flp pilus assembly protein TadD